MRQDTKARSITQAVKKAVAMRDSFDGWPCCINCGMPAPPDSPTAFSCAHFISRAQGGIGTPENIITLCPACHRRYDQTTDRKRMREYFREYLKNHYPNWDERDLIYRRNKDA